MEKMWMRSIVMLALCLSVACGKSKNGSPSQVLSKPASPSTPTDANKNKTPAPNGPQGGGAPTDGKNSSKNGKDGQKDLKGNPVSPSGKKPAKAQEKSRSQIPTAPVMSPQEAQLNINQFTGAGDDGLREFLTALQKQKSPEQQARDQQLAASVAKAGLRINAATGQIQIVLTLSNSGKIMSLNLGGRFGATRVTKLASKTKSLSGKLTCMDELTEAGQTCETSVADVKYNGAQVQVIFRQTPIHLKFVFPDHNCATQECEDFYTISRYTEANIKNDAKSFKSGAMSSFEVVQGRSAFRISALTNDNQIIKLSGLLIAPPADGILNIPLDRTLSAADLVDPVTHEVRKTRLNEALHDVRLMTNDGRGHLSLLVKMKLLEDGSRDQFEIQVSRTLKPISTPMISVRSANGN